MCNTIMKYLNNFYVDIEYKVYICWIFFSFLGPPLACYGMRWYANELERAHPNTFHIRVTDSEESPSELLHTLLVIPTVMYVILWTIPYSVTIFYLRFNKIKESGYETMYNAYGTSLVRRLGYFGERFKPAVYMAIHGSLCFLSFLLSQLLWRSFWLHTAYLLSLLSISVWNGSTYYFEVIAALLFMFEEMKSHLLHWP